MVIKRRNDTSLVSLAGGLGNQMFQLAAGIALSNGKKVELEGAVAYPRRNYLNVPEIQSFQLPQNVFMRADKKPTWLINKTANLFLRMSASRVKFHDFPGYRLINFMGTLVASAFFREVRKVRASTDLGDSNLNLPKGGTYLIGLFQSFRWAQTPEVEEKMMGLRILSPSDELRELEKASQTERPLIVHVRLGDYLAEVDFGIPSVEYYRSAISQALESNLYGAIWLFSNDLPGALEHIPKNLLLPIRTIGDIGKTSAESLEAMRFGNGYVIANSTFSWWGAFLSYNKGANVFYPDPWFKSTHAPKNLIPPNWISVQAWN